MSVILDNLDRDRAAGASRFLATGATVGDEPLVIDLPQPQGALQGSHWIVEQLMLTAHLTVRQPLTAGVPPITGLFLCPPATPIETLAQAVAGWNRDARPYPLPLNGCYCCSTAIVGTGGFAMALVMNAGFKISVPSGWFLRAIVTCQAGNAAPGPGALSAGTLFALLRQELDECA